MRVPAGRHIYRHIRFIIVFIFGMLTGIIIFLFIYGQQLDTLIIKVRELENQNVEYLGQIVTMEKTEKLLKSKKAIVKAIEIHPKAPNALIATESKRLLIKDLSFLKDRPLEHVANFHEGLQLLLGNRRYTIENQIYIVQLKTLVVSETLHVYVEIKAIPQL
ncbi:MAG TPA: hypothetical protein DDY49_06205 [Paenibacillaceae bacterium]|nr:hypothetical protein [Paenibacillaceae bacterium]